MEDPIEISPSTLCERCEQDGLITFYCASCSCSFCDPCWPKMPPHKPGKEPLGRPHLKESKAVIDMMHEIMEPPTDHRLLQRMHANDQESRWLGVTLSRRGGATQFQDFQRYSAGKSTLINALISRSDFESGSESDGKLHRPVPGSTSTEGIATSEGVHLYADPELLSTARPILYADCEGLNAGERPPYATESTSIHRQSTRAKLQKRVQVRSKEIIWTKTQDPQARTREFAVGQLYPRFLYTFSDAIVFVQKNPRQIHDTYTKLVNWAKHNVEESINQPILPHAIVVLNAVDIGFGNERWTIDDATNSFFRDVAPMIAQDQKLNDLARLRDIDVTANGAAVELLKRFYSEVRVIRIPAKHPDRYSLINQQIQQLRKTIISAADSTHAAKVVKRRVNDVDALQEYLQAGFDHFAARIDEPFDFKSVSLRKRNIAQDFGDHILTLASTVQSGKRVRNKVLFQGLVPLVASSILLDTVRTDRPDSVMDYFRSDYAPLCSVALLRFCEEYVPCEFVDRRGHGCENVKATHDKGHQVRQGGKGKITPGPYTSAFQVAEYEHAWLQGLEARLSQLEKEFDYLRTERLKAKLQVDDRKSDLQVAVDLHKRALTEFFAMSQSEHQYFSNTTCFGCLMAIPEVPLGCGHAFCNRCIKENGEAFNDLAVYLNYCPLHPQDVFENEWEVSLRPEFAGVRILSLDGGGMRGIVELEVLRAIEGRLNLGDRRKAFIPVQRFFDLVVGTSTGGIVALGLTVRNWTIDQCISKFVELCDEAFTPRELQGTSLEVLATLNHGSKWKTQPLHQALQNAFEQDLMFGGQTSVSDKYTSKVAVVSSTQPDLRSLIITNYNREETSDPGYSIEQPNHPSKTMKVWQAGAATSAAPSYFKAFECNSKTYLDGALNHNNPVYVAWREKKLIWPDMVAEHPDIFLSLGTGQNKADIDKKLDKDKASKTGRTPRKDSPTKEPLNPKNRNRFRAWNGIMNYLSVLVSKIDNILNTERTWEDFCADVVGEAYSTPESGRYIRINPDLRSTPPALDDKARMIELQQTVRMRLAKDSCLVLSIEDVANRLFASSFHFRKEATAHIPNGFECTGSLCSRFEGKPACMEQVGYFLRSQMLREFVPQFIITRQLSVGDRSRFDKSEDIIFPIDKDQIDRIIERKEFHFDTPLTISVGHRDEPIYICLRLRREGIRDRIPCRDYPISGFPRRFHDEEERQAERLKKHTADKERARSQKNASSNSVEKKTGSMSFDRMSGHMSPILSTIGLRSSSHHRTTSTASVAEARTASSPAASDGVGDSEYGTDADLARMEKELDVVATEGAELEG